MNWWLRFKRVHVPFNFLALFAFVKSCWYFSFRIRFCRCYVAYNCNPILITNKRKNAKRKPTNSVCSSANTARLFLVQISIFGLWCIQFGELLVCFQYFARCCLSHVQRACMSVYLCVRTLTVNYTKRFKLNEWNMIVSRKTHSHSALQKFTWKLTSCEHKNRCKVKRASTWCVRFVSQNAWTRTHTHTIK